MTARIHLPSSNSEYRVIERTFNEMADSLEQKITQINEVDKMRKEIIANISHDLRTPVASILGYTELLLDKNDTLSKEERKNYLSIVDINSRKIEKQIQDLFDLSKLESGHYKLHLEPLHLGELITDISNKYKIIANKKGVNLNTIFSKELPIIRADIALIDRALQNLVDNAMKYSDKGGTINIDIGQKNGHIIVTVSDTGQGIAETELPYVFDRFKIGEKNTSGSTGLGLAIVKKIIDLHNYAIQVISQEKVGTTFTVSIPLA
jgi:signal transduction histidine kinase